MIENICLYLSVLITPQYFLELHPRPCPKNLNYIPFESPLYFLFTVDLVCAGFFYKNRGGEKTRQIRAEIKFFVCTRFFLERS